MPRLLLLRHAKSSWDTPGQDDIDRPLSPRGRETVALVADTMAARGLLPDHILCSPARRTRETLAALVAHVGSGTRIHIAPELYEPPSGDYLETIRRNTAGAKVLLVIGHNPAIQATALALIVGGDPALREALAGKYPTAAIAGIDFDDRSWAKLAPHSGELAVFLRPRDLPGGENAADD